MRSCKCLSRTIRGRAYVPQSSLLYEFQGQIYNIILSNNIFFFFIRFFFFCCFIVVCGKCFALRSIYFNVYEWNVFAYKIDIVGRLWCVWFSCWEVLILCVYSVSIYRDGTAGEKDVMNIAAIYGTVDYWAISHVIVLLMGITCANITLWLLRSEDVIAFLCVWEIYRSL